MSAERVRVKVASGEDLIGYAALHLENLGVVVDPETQGLTPDGRRNLDLAMGGWRDEAACLDSPQGFVPEDGVSTAQARRVCFGCPVRAQCLVTEVGSKFPERVAASLEPKNVAALKRAIGLTPSQIAGSAEVAERVLNAQASISTQAAA